MNETEPLWVDDFSFSDEDHRPRAGRRFARFVVYSTVFTAFCFFVWGTLMRASDEEPVTVSESVQEDYPAPAVNPSQVALEILRNHGDQLFVNKATTSGILDDAPVTAEITPTTSGEPTGSDDAGSERDSRQSTPSGLVAVATIELQSLEAAVTKRTFTGVATPARASDLGFKRVGRLESIFADLGDKVVEGELLAILDTASLDAEKAVILAELRAAEARLEELKSGPRRETIMAAKAKLKELASLVDLWQTTFQRKRRLLREQAAAQQDLDESRLQLAASKGRYEAQLQVVKELEAGTRREQLDAQRAVVQRLEASAQRLDVQLNESRLTSPYTGVVSQRLADEGNIVAPGTTVLRIVQEDAPEAWIGVPVAVAANLNPGDAYQINVNGMPAEATLQSVLPELDTMTRTQTAVFEMQLDVPVSFGQMVRLDWQRTQKSEGFWLPTSALSHGVKGLWSVFAVVRQSEQGSPHVVERRDVEVLHFESDQVLVRGTLQPGDRIVTGGLQKLVPGQEVQLAFD